ncbi:MAG: AsmA-like C-terminal region-containing protein [Myxococcota bacterium]|nr:AsmA-like C-terminal region-containing protein [Myxococcota bacterium]
MRKLLIVLGVLVLVAAGAVALVVANLESYVNDNRDWVAEQAQTALGRGVGFGEVGISLWGGLAVRVADLRIDDDPAFSKEPFVTAGAIDLRVALGPALRGEIVVDRAVLRSPSITVIQTSSGLSTASLGGAAEADAEPAEPEPTDAEAGLPAFVVATVDISNGTLRYVDRSVEPPVERAIEQLDFRASNVSPTGPIDFTLDAAVLGASQPNVRIEGTVTDLANPKAGFRLTSSALELAPGAAGAPPDVLRELEIAGDLSLPQAGPLVKATLRSPRGTLAGAAYRDLSIEFEFANEVAELEALRVGAFDGELEVAGSYDMRKPERPRFDVRSKLSSMRIEQIVASQSAEYADAFRGELGGDLALTGSGTEWERIKPSLRGKGSVQLVDGTLKDVNLVETALQGITGVPGLSELLPASLRRKHPEVFGVGDTVFENMDTKLDLRDGWATIRDFRLAARDYAFAGDGRYSLDNELRMKTVLTLSEPLSEDLTDAAEPMRYLRDAEGRVAFPVKLQGTAPDIQAVPDVSHIAKAASRQAVGKLLDDVLGESKQPPADGTPAQQEPEDAARELLRKGLGDLFGD